MGKSHGVYILEAAEEGRRLEEQAALPAYRVEDEYRFYEAAPSHSVLDAGTGTGVVARHLASRFPVARVDAFDVSELRLEQAKREAARVGLRSIRFFEGSVLAIPGPEGSYDRVTCRFVLEHLAEPAKAVEELFRVLKPGGVAYIVDLDGIFFNAYGPDDEVNRTLESLRGRLPADLFMGRKIPRLLHDAGFVALSRQIDLQAFAGTDLDAEIELMRQRLAFVRHHLAEILGAGPADRFIDGYLKMLSHPASVLFCNKFIVTGTKPAP